MKRLCGLMVGAGYFSQFHLDAWQRMPDVEMLAICDVDPARAKGRAQEFHIPRTFANAAVALDELEFDFVDIVTRCESHQPLVELAAARGLAVICQKPLAPDLSAARAMVSAAEMAGVPFMVHENFRFQPWHRELGRLIRAGVIGSRLHSLSFRSRPGDGWGDDAYRDRQPYFREMPRLLIFETGIHIIDTMRFLGGEITETYAVLRRLNSQIVGEDAGLVTFRFAGGAVGTWDANRYNESTAADPRLTFGELLIEGSGGSLRLHDDGRITVQPLGQPERAHAYAWERRGFSGDCVYQTQRHFIERWQAGEAFETSGQEYLKSLAVQECVYLSAAENRPVPIETSSGASSRSRRIVDLSLVIDNELRGVLITPGTSIAENGYNTSTLSLYSHCGTHMDAPRHFVEDGDTIDRQQLDVCQGMAKVLDLTPVAPRELLSVERLRPWADAIAPGDRLLLRTDWHKLIGTLAYRNDLPRISPELARWLVERKVALIGVEPPSVADVNNLQELTVVHQTLLKGGVVIVEGLAHLDQIRRPMVEFIALPLKIAAGDGCPVRAIAIEET